MPRCTIVSFALALGAVAGCGEAAPDPQNPLAQLTAAAEQMQKAAEGFTKRKPVPPVAFRELIEYLPRKVGGLARKEPKGQTTTAGSWQYSQAEVTSTTRTAPAVWTSGSSTTPTFLFCICRST